MFSVVVTSATAEPISLADTKNFLRVTTTDDNDLISAMITAARKLVEQKTNQKLMHQRWRTYYGEWPIGKRFDHIQLPFAPLVTILSTGVTYKNSSGQTRVFSSTAWAKDVSTIPPRLVLDYNDQWPTDTLHNNNPITIDARYGYSTAGASSGALKVPQNIKLVMYQLIGGWYENRESISIKSSNIVPMGVDALLNDYRVWRY